MGGTAVLENFVPNFDSRRLLKNLKKPAQFFGKLNLTERCNGRI